MAKTSRDRKFDATLQTLLKTPPAPHKPLGKKKAAKPTAKKAKRVG